VVVDLVEWSGEERRSGYQQEQQEDERQLFFRQCNAVRPVVRPWARVGVESSLVWSGLVESNRIGDGQAMRQGIDRQDWHRTGAGTVTVTAGQWEADQSRAQHTAHS
jgi:hypothetical protein